tara:strand:+ start:610 stop:756 length:147 start_codon:yes stop_codon:yes gene_type:complete
MDKMKIISWNIVYTTQDGKEHYVAEVPDWVADDIDEFLTTIEEGANNG